MVTMETEIEYLSGGFGNLEDDMTCLTLNEDDIVFIAKQENMNTATPISFTRVTSISSSSDEDFCYQHASMYDTTSLLSINSESSSEDLSDNQCVPECDSNFEMASRTQYYSDFITDHHHLSLRCENDSAKSSDDSDCDEIPFPRIVEGCEDSSIASAVNHNFVRNSFQSKSAISKFSNSSSSVHQGSRHSSRTKRRRSSLSIPRASSTMIRVPSYTSGHISCKRSGSFTPKSSSTMIGNLKSQPVIQCTKNEEISDIYCSLNAEDFHSVYTWSINDDGCNEGSLEELYLQKINGQQLVAKPPLPPKKNVASRNIRNLTKSSSGSSSITRSCEPMSRIETLSSYRDSVSDVDGMKENSVSAEYLPRTSTRACLFSSVPSKCVDDFHKAPRKNIGSRNVRNITKSSSGSSVARSIEPMSGIETLSSYRDSVSDVESMRQGSENNGECELMEYIPRTSTRVCLFSPVLSNSVDDFHKVPECKKPSKGLRRSSGGIFKKQTFSSKHGSNTASSVKGDSVIFEEFTAKHQENYVKDKQTVMKKLKRFSKSLLRQDNNSHSKIQTLANL